MHRLFRLFAFLPLILSAASCSQHAEATEETDNGIRKSYYANGALYMEASYQEGMLNGITKEYYDNGKLFQEVNYEKNLMNGLLKRYYKSGVLSQETPYVNGAIHGIQKKYRRSGQLMCEVPYHEGNICIGLKEYSIDDTLKKLYPSIVITPVDRILTDEQYTLKIGLSDDSKGGVEYYFGKLKEGKYIGTDAERIWPVEDGVAKVDYYMPAGAFMMEQLFIIAKVKTSQDNYYITQLTYNLAIENRF